MRLCDGITHLWQGWEELGSEVAGSSPTFIQVGDGYRSVLWEPWRLTWLLLGGCGSLISALGSIPAVLSSQTGSLILSSLVIAIVWHRVWG